MFLSVTVNAQVNVVSTGGTTSASYPTLTAAFAAVNAGTHTGTLNINISGDTNEGTGSALLNASGTGAASYTTILVTPTGARTISGSVAGTPLIDFNGADNVTIDGLNTGGNTLTINNTSTGAAAGTIRFIGDATNNTVKNSTIIGAGTSTTSGTIFFSTGAAAGTGNDGNIISNNTITSGASTATNAIYSAGTSTAIDNSGITISNNNIADYFNASNPTNGIYLVSNSSAWTISGNKFYQTATRTATAAGSTNKAILINTASGGGYTINNNIIGFANSTGTGVTAYAGAFNLTYSAISISAAATPVSNIQGNTISGITISNTTSGGSVANPVFGGIIVAAGGVNVGTTTGNTIGSTTGTGAVTVTGATNAYLVLPIYATSATSVIIQNNTIGSISATGTAATVGVIFTGITVAGTGSHTVSSNTVGNATAGNISLGTVGTSTGVCTVKGIESTSTGATTIGSIGAGNTVQNINVNAGATNACTGIMNGGAGTTLNINYNTIRGIVFGAAAATSSTFSGIANTAALTTSAAINNNVFDNLNIKANGTIYLINNNNSTNNSTIDSNSINTALTVNGTGTVYGYYNFGSPTGGTTNISNNNFSNITLTGATAFVGVRHYTSSTQVDNIYNNTITNISGGSSSVYAIQRDSGASGSKSYGNTIGNISTGSAANFGIYIGGSSANNGVYSMYKNKIYGLSSTSALATVYGINVSAAGTTVNVYNNTVGNLTAPNASNTTTDVIRGISLSGTSTSSTIGIYYNSIYLNASGGTNFTTSGIYHLPSSTASTYNLILRNNIVINNSNPGTGGLTIALRRSALVNLSNYDATSNNNLFYAGTPSASNLIYYDGTNSDQTLGAFQTRIAARETLSQTENTSFISTTGSNVDFLRIAAGSTSAAESNAVAISTPNISDDYWGITRPFPSPVNGGTAPDIGASEFDGIPTDTTPPTITYTALTNTCATSVTLTATVTDTGSGVPTSGAGLPVAYYKINSGTYNAVQGVYVSGNSYTFNIGSGSVAGDTVSYYIVAQDAKAGTPNVSASPSAGTSGFTASPPKSATPPTTPSSYTVASTTGGTASATPATLCNSGTSVISVAGYGTGASITYQWQSSTDNFATNTVDIGTASSTYSNYTTPTISSTMYYRLKVNCTATSTFNTSTSVSVTVSTPTITGATPGSRCGAGTVTLGATGSAGTVLNWYAAATGGAPLGTGNSFVTPSISATTPYYVEAGLVGPGNATIGAGGTTATSYEGIFYHLYGGAQTQFLVRASELKSMGLVAGNITSLSINMSTVTARTYAGFAVSILGTSNTDMSAGLNAGSFTSVYSNALFSPTTGTNNFTFSSPFTWDGTSNIIIKFCWSNNNGGSQSNFAKVDSPGFTAGAYYRADNLTPAVICAGTTATGTLTLRPQFTFTGQVANCISARTPVTATIATAPNLTLSTAAATNCNGSSSSVALTSTASDFDTYVWSATTGTGALPTGNQTTGWTFTPATTTTYTLTATNTTTGCTNSVTYTVTVLPTSTAIAANSSSFCGSGTPSLSLNPSTGYGAATYQWQSSTDGTTYSDISGATAATYTAGSAITATTYYKVIIKDSNGNTCLQPTIQITVNNPQVLTTTPGARCGTGTVNLSATGSARTVLNWYAGATGGASLGTGNSFTTPAISATTNYWVGASTPGAPAETVGKASSPGTDGNYNGTGSGLVFNVTSPLTLNSAVIYPVGTGTVTLALLNSSGTELAASSAISVSGTGIATPVTVSLGFSVPIGTGYRLVLKSFTGITGLIRDFASAFPYNSTNVAITGGWLSSASTSYYYFYNLNFTANCTNPTRTQVTATVTTAPAVTLVNDGAPLCAGSSKLITLSSAAGNYLNYAWSVTSGTGALPTGDQTAGWTFTPASTTTYSLNASNSDPLACVTTATLTISVNPAPASITLAETPVSPGGTTTCDLDYVKLDATPGLVNNYSQNFDPGNDLTGVTVTNGNTSAAWGLYTVPYAGGSPDEIALEASGTSTATANWYLYLPVTNVSSYSTLSISFKHYLEQYGGAAYVRQLYLETSTNGTTWTNTAWTVSPNADIPATTVNVDLTSLAGTSTLYFRFRFRGAAYGLYYWAIDDIVVSGTPKVTWSPTAGLYTDAALTTPYVSGSANTVYASPETAQTYTATASLGTCTKTASSASIVTDKKTFTGSVNSNWSVAGNWLRGSVPTAAKCVNIPSGKTVVVDVPNAVAKNVTVAAGGKLTVNRDQTLTVADAFVNSNASNAVPATAPQQYYVMIESGGNLLQTNGVPNTGSVSARREITVKDNSQYNYLISPLIGSNLKTKVYEDQTTKVLTDAPFTLYYNESNNKFYASSGAYIPGRGLAVKEPAASVVAPSGKINALFTGVPMNGDLTYTLANTGSAETGYNLVGNPYPSNIDIKKLYDDSVPMIDSNFKFWDNSANAITVQQGSNYKGAAYAVFNAASGPNGSGVSAPGNSVVDPNNPASPAGTKTPNHIVKVGQAFMVKALTLNGTLSFKNTQRLADQTGSNFFGKNGTIIADDRYWLELVTPTNLSISNAVVYFEGGNNNFAKDDTEESGTSDALFSYASDKKVVINGRNVFNINDVLNLGTRQFTSGIYKIKLGNREGIFANGQHIYLKDRQTGIITDLTAGVYSFSANAGESTGRFEIVYQPETVLATDASVKEDILVYRDGTDFVVKAASKKITDLQVYDAAGRMVAQMQPNSTKAVIDGTRWPSGVYILKADLQGRVVSKKIQK